MTFSSYILIRWRAASGLRATQARRTPRADDHGKQQSISPPEFISGIFLFISPDAFSGALGRVMITNFKMPSTIRPAECSVLRCHAALHSAAAQANSAAFIFSGIIVARKEICKRLLMIFSLCRYSFIVFDIVSDSRLSARYRREARSQHGILPSPHHITYCHARAKLAWAISYRALIEYRRRILYRSHALAFMIPSECAFVSAHRIPLSRSLPGRSRRLQRYAPFHFTIIVKASAAASRHAPAPDTSVSGPAQHK